MKKNFLKVLVIMLSIFIATPGTIQAKSSNIRKTTKQGMNVRMSPTVKSRKIGYVKRNKIIIGENVNRNRWFKIRYGNRTGYVSNKSLRTISSKTLVKTPKTGSIRVTRILGSGMNVRKLPSVRSSKIGYLRKGSRVTGTYTSNGWFRISHNGRTAYLSGKYLKTVSTATPVKPVITTTTSKSSGFSWPTTQRYISSRFGYRSDPFNKTRSKHNGIDISGPSGAPIRATSEGIVKITGYNKNGWGKYIRINHGNGLESIYAHLSSYQVRPGQRVVKGQLIGRMGTTGRSTGVHLHYEMRKNGTPVNPLNYIR